MSKKVKQFRKGDLVECFVWACDHEEFLVPGRSIGLVLEAEKVEMGEVDRHEYGYEWMYRVSLTDGRIVEAWEYEIKLVNKAA